MKKVQGFSLLKAFMCFGVILAHFWSSKGYDSLIFLPFREIRTLAAPVFMILSFYFAKSLFSGDNDSFRRRMKRLLVPHICWAVIYYLFYLVIYRTPVTELFWQLCTGHSSILNATMWFQFELILLTVLFYGIFRILKEKKAILCLCILSVICLVLQISGLNYRIFSGLRFELSYPLGRFAEMLPYACLGLVLRYFDLYSKLKRHPLITMAVSLVLFVLPYFLPFPRCDGFGYAGITLIYACFLAVTFAAVLPLDGIGDPVESFIDTLCRFTPGIYCCHRLIFAIVSLCFPGTLFFHTLFGCVVIYLLSYLFCLILSLLPIRDIRLLVD